MKKMTTHEEILKLVLWLNEHKDMIQKKLDSGYTVLALSFDKGVSVGAMRKALNAVGITHGRELGIASKKNKPYLGAILAVLARVCQQLDVNHDEIKPYL